VDRIEAGEKGTICIIHPPLSSVPHIYHYHPSKF
jgi:hypothetical protein